MGWTGLHREKGLSDREFFEKEFPIGLTQRGRVLECASTFEAFFAIVENGPDAGSYSNQRWVLVVLKTWGRGYYNFHYKDMDEAMGPCGTYCPPKFLEAVECLVPTPPNESAAEWRRGCKEHVVARAAAKQRAKSVAEGAVLKFAKPIQFQDESTWDTLVYQGQNLFRPEGGYGRYRITDWKERAYELV